jgi:hypothetical protein
MNPSEYPHISTKWLVCFPPSVWPGVVQTAAFFSRVLHPIISLLCPGYGCQQVIELFHFSNTSRPPWLLSNLMHKILIYLHIIHLLKSSTCFEHYYARLQEVYVVIVYMQPLVSSLSAGDCLVHRLRKSYFLTGAQDSHLQTVTIAEAAYIQLRRRPPDDEQGNGRNM